MYVVSKRNRIVKPLHIEALKRATATKKRPNKRAQSANGARTARADEITFLPGFNLETIVTAQLLCEQTMQSGALQSVQSIGIDAYQSALDRKIVRLQNGTYYREKA